MLSYNQCSYTSVGFSCLAQLVASCLDEVGHCMGQEIAWGGKMLIVPLLTLPVPGDLLLGCADSEFLCQELLPNEGRGRVACASTRFTALIFPSQVHQTMLTTALSILSLLVYLLPSSSHFDAVLTPYNRGSKIQSCLHS